MPRKRQPHNKTISMQESHAYIVPLDEVIATKKFSKLFRDKPTLSYVKIPNSSFLADHCIKMVSFSNS